MMLRFKSAFVLLFVGAAAQAQTEVDDIESLVGLLEFLVEFETDDGQWIDPQLLPEDDGPELRQVSWSEEGEHEQRLDEDDE